MPPQVPHVPAAEQVTPPLHCRFAQQSWFMSPQGAQLPTAHVEPALHTPPEQQGRPAAPQFTASGDGPSGNLPSAESTTCSCARSTGLSMPPSPEIFFRSLLQEASESVNAAATTHQRTNIG
jgi:hypothetical protein